MLGGVEANDQDKERQKWREQTVWCVVTASIGGFMLGVLASWSIAPPMPEPVKPRFVLERR